MGIVFVCIKLKGRDLDLPFFLKSVRYYVKKALQTVNVCFDRIPHLIFLNRIQRLIGKHEVNVR